MRRLSLILTLGCQATAVRVDTPPASAGKPPPHAAPLELRSVLPEPPDRGRDARAPGRGLPGVRSDCASNASVRHRAFDYVNEVFDADGARGAFEQCLLVRRADGVEARGWTWSWSFFEPRGVGFLGIVFGWKSPSPRTTDARLPIAVTELQSLTVRYRVVTESAGPAPLALSLSFVPASAATAQNGPTIVSQAVVWLDYLPSAEPAGSERAVVGIGGARYELWHASTHVERGGSPRDVFTFRGPNRHPEGTVRLEPFVAHLVNEKLVAPELFLASVELGNAIAGGSGTTWVEDYDVQLASRRAR